jgi:protein gp37
MGETNIQWCARHTVDPRGTCAHGATDEGRCLDVECKRCWVKGYSANVWIGCEKVSAACRSCWAEAVAKRMGLDVWGAGADRQLTGDAVFASIRSWNKKAERTGQRRGVFWEDMGDLFEDRPEFVERRTRAFEAMEAAPMLDHMLLTKRPENIRNMVPRTWLDNWPKHVWPGATAENQELLDERAPHILRLKSERAWLSVEPMLGPLDVAEYMAERFCMDCRRGVPDGEESDPGADVRATWIDPECPGGCPKCNGETASRYPDEILSLIIWGGESGPGARPLDLVAAEAMVAQCDAFVRTALFTKQFGSRWAQANPGGLRKGASHGQDPYRWPAWARRRELPMVSP